VSKFLSEEWASDVTTALNEHDGFKNAIGAADLEIQFVTEGGADGDVDYYLSTSGGTAKMALGDLDDPDVTVKQSYDTAAAISKGDLNTQTAFMTGKLLAVVDRQARDRYSLQHVDNDIGDAFGRAILDSAHQTVSPISIDNRDECRPVARSADQIGLPVARFRSVFHICRPFVDSPAVRNPTPPVATPGAMLPALVPVSGPLPPHPAVDRISVDQLVYPFMAWHLFTHATTPTGDAIRRIAQQSCFDASQHGRIHFPAPPVCRRGTLLRPPVRIGSVVRLATVPCDLAAHRRLMSTEVPGNRPDTEIVFQQCGDLMSFSYLDL